MTEGTFQFQSKLPHLPVPSLEETCDKYLKSSIPFLTPSEFERTKKIVEEFKSGDGKRLQEKLLQRAQQEDSWLSEWWLIYAYLIFRCPNPINVNYFFLFDEDINKQSSQLQQAARFITWTLKFKQLLEEEQIPVEFLKGKTPLCMNQLRKIFTTERYPGFRVSLLSLQEGREVDTVKSFPPTSKVIVICKKQFFVLDTKHLDGNVLTTEQFEHQLFRIQEEAKSVPEPEFSVGVMTAADRTDWAIIREKLEYEPINRKSLSTIDESAFVVVLDENTPNNSSETAYLTLTGNASNRWFDKVFQLIFYANGRSGLNGEHSPLDAPATGRMVDYVIRMIRENKADPFKTSTTAERPLSSLPKPQRLHWKISNEVVAATKKANFEYESARNDLKLRVTVFNDFGAEWIRNNTAFGPDPFFQVALQLAYYRLYSKPCATYETGQTRQFKLGRTETIRSCSLDTFNFTKAMVSSDVSDDKRYELLNKALQGHVKYTNDAVNAKGCDRHLLGLKILAIQELKEEGKDLSHLPEIYRDKTYKEGIHFRLSTSNLNGKGYIPGFGPVVPDGYGVCYRINNDALQIVVTNFQSADTTDADKLQKYIHDSLRDVKQLVERNRSKKSKL